MALAVTCLFLLVAASGPGTALAIKVGPKPTAPPGLIVKLKSAEVAVSSAAGAALQPIDAELGLYRVRGSDRAALAAQAAAIAKLKNVAYVVADEWPRKPNDAFYPYQWGMPRIRAEQAWAQKLDATSVFVCIVDTGVKYNHPDLVANLAPMTADWQSKNTDDNGHGTHVAGTIGAVGNDKIGVTGVAWKTRILACKALDSNGWGLISKVIECIQWCRSRGAKVINTSFELATENIPLKEAIGNGTQAGVFFAGAAGNTEGGNDNDISNRYPGGYKFPGNVAVANLNIGNTIDYTSNFGARTVQLAAPGTNILSTWIYTDFAGQYYTKLTGTSMAAPCVAGAAALAIAASGGTLTNAQVANMLIKTSTPVTALKGLVVSNGVINLQSLISEAILFGKAARVAG